MRNNAVVIRIHRGSYMSAPVLLNLLSELGTVIKCEACRAFYHFFTTSLITSIIQEQVYSIYHMTLKLL